MKIETSIEAIISDEILARAERFSFFEPSNFNQQVDFLGLDPKRDFQNADLCFVDFTDCDLRGFNFKGADLRRSTGVRTSWDDSTSFDGAQTDGSIFHYGLAKQRFFDANPDLAEQVAILRNEHWTNVILTVEAMLRADRHTGKALRVARAVFDETTSSTVRSEILLYMSLGMETRDEHKAFIYNTLSKYRDDPRVLRTTLRTLRSLYVNDLDAFNMMAPFVRHEDERVSQEAALGVLTSTHFKSAQAEVKEAFLSSSSSLTRRAFIARIARVEFHQFCEVLLDNEFSNYIDFLKPISNVKIERMASVSLRNRTLDGIQSKEMLSFTLDRDSYLLRKHPDPLIERTRLIKEMLIVIRSKYGVPFVLDDHAIT